MLSLLFIISWISNTRSIKPAHYSYSWHRSLMHMSGRKCFSFFQFPNFTCTNQVTNLPSPSFALGSFHISPTINVFCPSSSLFHHPMPEQVMQALTPTPHVMNTPGHVCSQETLLHSIGGQHMYNIKRSVHDVATTVCYDLYLSCSYPIQIRHIIEI